MDKVIGIDLGGTKINASLIDEDGNIVASNILPTQGDLGRDVVLDNVKKAIFGLPGHEEAKAIGIGTPGFIDSKNGIVTFAGNIEGWTGLNLKEAIEAFVDLPVFVENDANIALRAEKWVGVAQDYESIVMITLGSGVGGAYYDHGFMLEGSHFQGAELGHVILHPGGEYCTCGQYGCVEAYCSGRGFERIYESKSGHFLKGEEIFRNASEDEIAASVVEDYCSDLAYFMTSLRNIFDPEIIVIGGGVINSSEYWWDKTMSKFASICHNYESIKVEKAHFLNDAGCIGAGKIAFERLRDGQ